VTEMRRFSDTRMQRLFMVFALFAAATAAGAAPATTVAPGPAVPMKPPPPNRVFEARLDSFDADSYAHAAESLLAAFERQSGQRLAPGRRGRLGLKVYSDSGAGLGTSPDLVRGLIASFERRGFARDRMFILGLNASRLRASGFLPPLSVGGADFDGVPVRVLDSGAFYDPEWFYDSPLPSQLDTSVTGEPRAEAEQAAEPAASEADRRSFLATPLLFEVDFWVNLPMCSDHPVLGVNAALLNATLWNASNTQRFFRSPATAPAAVAEMAAVPELRETWALNIVSLQRYQFIGGPVFNSLYTVSEPIVWLSENPVIIDALMRERIDRERRAAGFRGLPDDLRLVAYAEQLGLGSGNLARTDWVRVP
jgi:hypothetical protein